MNVLAVKLEPSIVSFLRSKDIWVDTGETIVTSRNISNWLENGIYDVCLIGLTKRGFDTSVARTLRLRGVTTPLVGVVSSPEDRSWSDLRATFLEHGGDDLLKEPNPREVVASLQAIIRRLNRPTQNKLEYQIGDAHLTINNASRIIALNGNEIELSKKERELLLLFAKAPNRLFTEEAMHTLLYEGNKPASNVIIGRISRLRIKLRTVHPDAEKFICLVRGSGYVFRPRGEVH